MMHTVDYIDDEGIPRRVRVPFQYADPREGIPTGLLLDEYMDKLRDDFRRALYIELHAVGIVTPADALKPGALKLIQNALLAALRLDAQTIQKIALSQTGD